MEHDLYQKIWETIPEEDQEELAQVFDAWRDELDCMDNLRIARIGNAEQESIYFDMRDEGCCGYVDEIKMCSSARQYRIGCNYGH